MTQEEIFNAGEAQLDAAPAHRALSDAEVTKLFKAVDHEIAKMLGLEAEDAE
ncbi:hypothetical protein [Nesterenkonia alba]|uniref:hypothetical protein n=1 Tax=Nesterenkonia alba TaxID=515814 RepID=UPI0003B308D2|nr:hypothetical protein [Nesterenkonia alba]